MNMMSGIYIISALSMAGLILDQKTRIGHRQGLHGRHLRSTEDKTGVVQAAKDLIGILGMTTGRQKSNSSASLQDLDIVVKIGTALYYAQMKV